MITRRLTILLVSLALTGFAAVPRPASAQAANDAQQLVSKLSDDAIKLLTGKELAEQERYKRFRELLKQNFDLPVMGRFVLGRYWRDATDQERQDYLKLFEDLIVATYAQRFADYKGESFKILGSQPEADKGVLVQSQITRLDPPQPIKVDWRVVKGEPGLRIVDVVVEGVSLSVTQRSEFASVIQRNGGKIAGLLEALRSKTKELNAPG
jgi:phospholipid transport system substrate-binding protein